MDTTVADPLVGRLLDGRYRVESRIARGGMAAVYLALDIRLDRTVALKVMHRSLAEDPDFVRRFIGEAKSVASLSHPNVVHVFDQGTDGDHVYLSMEYVPGRTLRDVLRERKRLPAREALEIMIPVLAALGAAHQAGMVHRDVKPENVLLTDDGRVKVVDFGLARAIEAGNQTRTGVMIGTIAYMSPEQVTAGVADARSDVYAAGVMLFELLTGRQPYQGDNPMSVAYRHVHDRVPAPSSLAGDVPPLLDTLVLSATDRDQNRRPADATALLVAAVDAHRMLPRDMGPQRPP
ncbi:protein kinase, partial [Sphaerisporangium sp. NPDC049002]